ncbi:MAG TPA: SET domain-containing protein-lysine N-methyltransferase [Pirellulales bacterium]|nr:SET domain-containing protein-lysine N-methyltransferase [Pirellulales bacterium]
MPRKPLPVCVEPSVVGQGVFASRKIRRNQTIGRIAGEIIEDPQEHSSYCMDLGDDRILEPAAPFRFLNHSCEPNAEITYWETADGRPVEALYLVALRTIQPGEELTIDYGWPADHAIPCRCGSAGCRGWVVCAEEVVYLRERSPAGMVAGGVA